jgi:hypothetical protein
LEGRARDDDLFLFLFFIYVFGSHQPGQSSAGTDVPSAPTRP